MMWFQYSVLILGRTVGQRLPSRETTSSSCSRPDHAMYFPQPALDWSNLSVAINQGVITGLPFYCTVVVNSCVVAKPVKLPAPKSTSAVTALIRTWEMFRRFRCGRSCYLVNLNREWIHVRVTVSAISLEFSDEHNIERDAPLRLRDCFSQPAGCARFPMVIKRNPDHRQRRWARW